MCCRDQTPFDYCSHLPFYECFSTCKVWRGHMHPGWIAWIAVTEYSRQVAILSLCRQTINLSAILSAETTYMYNFLVGFKLTVLERQPCYIVCVKELIEV